MSDEAKSALTLVTVLLFIAFVLLMLNPHPVPQEKQHHPNDYPSSYDPYLED